MIMADKTLAIAFNGKAVSQDFYEDIVSLTVTENSNSANTLELRLATELDEKGAWAYLEDKRFDPFTKVSVKFGFTSGGGLVSNSLQRWLGDLVERCTMVVSFS
jgi:hypothetical protein